MRHFTTPEFWSSYERLPEAVQRLADKNYELLKLSADHPSLYFKKVNRYWSVRVGLSHRALAVPLESDLIWFWIGAHAEYERLLRG